MTWIFISFKEVGLIALSSSPTPSEIVEAIKEVGKQVDSLTADDVGAATPAQVNAAIQSAISDTWEASY